MLSPNKKTFHYLIAFSFLVIFLLSACQGNRETTPGGPPGTDTPEPPGQVEPLPTDTLTPVPEPLVMRVNGEGVIQAEFDALLVQLQLADEELGIQRSPEVQRQMVIDELVDQTLLAQGARLNGFSADDALVESRIEQLAEQSGGAGAFNDWMTRMGYTPASLRSALRRSIEAAWQRDQILASVPENVEQIRARQILVRFEETANSVYRQLEAGADFATLALQYDPLTGGDLGWFPRGYLTQKDVEQAAFNLQPGEYSPIIQTSFGFHIIQVVEREERHPLSPDARLMFQQKALDDWLAAQRESAVVENLLP